MRYKAIFAVGFVTGYALGARAGRERYEQLKRITRSISHSPTIKRTTDAVQSHASALRTQTARKMQERAETMSHELRDKVVGRLPHALAERLPHRTINLDAHASYVKDAAAE